MKGRETLSAQTNRRRVPIIGDGGGIFSFIHVADAAAATVLALKHNRTGVYNIVEKSEANCRQAYHRARQDLQQHRPRFKPSPAAQQKLVTGVLQAIQTGDAEALTSLLAEDVTLWSDGGGKATAARHPLVGQERMAHLLLVSYRQRPSHSAIELAEVNSVLPLLFRLENQVIGVISFGGNDVVITDIWTVWNPDKLQYLN